VEHCCHEARGLDVLPLTISKFRSAGDKETAALLEDVIYAEEISHCAAGVRWLKHLHAEARRLQLEQQQHQAPVAGTSQQQQPEASQARPPPPAAALPDWAQQALGFESPETWFHSLVMRFYGNLKPPFNVEARDRAGFSSEWYLPLVRSREDEAAGRAAAAAAAVTNLSMGAGSRGEAVGGGVECAAEVV